MFCDPSFRLPDYPQCTSNVKMFGEGLCIGCRTHREAESTSFKIVAFEFICAMQTQR